MPSANRGEDDATRRRRRRPPEGGSTSAAAAAGETACTSVRASAGQQDAGRGVHMDGIRARVRKECAEQGVPEKVEDPAIIANVVTLAFEGLITPSRGP